MSFWHSLFIVYVEGQLRHTETGEPFVFQVKDDNRYNQAHYEALGKVSNTT